MKLLILLLPIFVYALNFDQLVENVKVFEGFSSKMYEDRGHTSIGYGTNLSNGLTKAEAQLLLVHRLLNSTTWLQQYHWFNKLTPARKQVLINMHYQLGSTGLLKFKHMIWALKHNHYNGAANQMKDSLWYRQSGQRAKDLVATMKRGY